MLIFNSCNSASRAGTFFALPFHLAAFFFAIRDSSLNYQKRGEGNYLIKGIKINIKLKKETSILFKN